MTRNRILPSGSSTRETYPRPIDTNMPGLTEFIHKTVDSKTEFISDHQSYNRCFHGYEMCSRQFARQLASYKLAAEVHGPENLHLRGLLSPPKSFNATSCFSIVAATTSTNQTRTATFASVPAHCAHFTHITSLVLLLYTGLQFNQHLVI